MKLGNEIFSVFYSILAISKAFAGRKTQFVFDFISKFVNCQVLVNFKEKYLA